MANIANSTDPITDLEIAGDNPVTESLLSKMGGAINYALLNMAPRLATNDAKQGANHKIAYGTGTYSGTSSATITPAAGKQLYFVVAFATIPGGTFGTTTKPIALATPNGILSEYSTVDGNSSGLQVAISGASFTLTYGFGFSSVPVYWVAFHAP